MRRDRQRGEASAEVAVNDDPYAAYVVWVREGRPSLEPTEVHFSLVIAAADDATEDAIGTGRARMRAVA